MADLKPFRGTFYNPQVVVDLSRAIAPPYDVIDEKKKQALLSRSPYNIARLILPQPGGGAEFWNNAATLFRAWKKGDVLSCDSARCFYVYRQTFSLPARGSVSRTGVLALLRCKEFSSGEILPHEKTFPRTRVERLNLLRACRANFSQIFTVFRDEEEEVLPLLQDATTDPCLIDVSDDEGVRHQVWRMEEGALSDKVKAALGGKKLIIADGHHRYETALAYSREKHASAGAARAAAYVSAVLFRSEDHGLAVLPVHRLLRRLPLTLEDARRRLERYFHVEDLQGDAASRAGMFGDRLASTRRPAFVMVTPGGVLLLVLREGVEPDAILKGQESSSWKNLDISVLHSLVMEESMGLDASALAEKGDLYYTPWESTAMSALGAGEAEAAFMVRPTRIEEIWDIAEGGERMPHKSSYFYPKLASGLIIYDHDTALS